MLPRGVTVKGGGCCLGHAVAVAVAVAVAARCRRPRPHQPDHPQRIGALAGGSVAAAASAAGSGWTDVKFKAAGVAATAARGLDPETAHNLTVAAAAAGLLPTDSRPDPACLATTVFGLHFSNPIGLAAGFDKDARAARAMLGLGLGFVEVGEPGLC